MTGIDPIDMNMLDSGILERSTSMENWIRDWGGGGGKIFFDIEPRVLVH